MSVKIIIQLYNIWVCENRRLRIMWIVSLYKININVKMNFDHVLMTHWIKQLLRQIFKWSSLYPCKIDQCSLFEIYKHVRSFDQKLFTNVLMVRFFFCWVYMKHPYWLVLSDSVSLWAEVSILYLSKCRSVEYHHRRILAWEGQGNNFKIADSGWFVAWERIQIVVKARPLRL